MAIQANVTNQQITASVGETQIDVAVSGGVGPTGNSGTIAVAAPITNAGTSTAAVLGLSTGTGLAVSGGSVSVTYGTSSGSACQGNDSRLSDAREWSASTVSQADAEAGTSTSRFAYTPLRVFQAIAAWWAGSSAKTKLDGIATGATANQTDAYLLSRANHTGTQTASTISDFTTAVVAAAPPTVNASLLVQGTLPDARLSGNIARTSDVSSAVAALVNSSPAALDTLGELATALGNDAAFSTTVTNALAAKAPLASPTFTGTVSGVTKAMVGLGSVDNVADASKPVSTAQAAADAAVASAAASDATTKAAAAQAAAVQRANHTGTQAASTITGLAAVATSGAYSSLTGTPSTFAPSAHKSSHATGGADALAPADIGAAAVSHTHSVSDVTGFSAAAAAAAPVQSVAGRSGAVTLAVADVSGAVGTSDSRLSDQRTPTDGSVTDAKITSGGLAASSINWAAIQPWAASTAYAKGDLVSYLGVGYRRSAAGTSGTTFNTANWQQVTPSELVGSQITSGTVAAARLGAHASTHQTGGSDAVANVVQSPSQITSNQNDYAPSAGDILRISSDAARTITGITAGSSGDVRVLVNVGSFSITLAHQSASSTAANRFLVSFSADYILASNAAAVLIYDATASRWRVV